MRDCFTQQSNPGTRQQEFAGIVLKCPNYSAVIGQTTTVCPECGHHIIGQAALSSVQAFGDKLMMFETRRKGSGLSQMMGMSAELVDMQKLALIQSFLIPNTIDDIQEFMLLAIANIDVALFKNTMTNRFQGKMKGFLNVDLQCQGQSVTLGWQKCSRHTRRRRFLFRMNQHSLILGSCMWTK